MKKNARAHCALDACSAPLAEQFSGGERTLLAYEHFARVCCKVAPSAANLRTVRVYEHFALNYCVAPPSE